MKRLTNTMFALFLLIAVKPIFAKPLAYISSELKNGNIAHLTYGINPQEQLEAGSIAKYICTLALLKAVDQQKLELNQPITAVLPYLKSGPLDEVLILNVLSNRSGLANNLSTVLSSDPLYPRKTHSTKKAVMDLVSDSLKFAPASQFDYELINWLIVQAILEQTYQQPISEVLQRLVFKPAGANRSEAFIGNLPAVNERISNAKSRPIPAFLTCAGGIKTTTSDLLLIAKQHFAMFSKKTLSMSLALTTKEQSYALGGRFKQVATSKGSILVSHQSGQNGEFRAAVVYIPSLQTGFAIMTPDRNVDIDMQITNWLAAQLSW